MEDSAEADGDLDWWDHRVFDHAQGRHTQQWCCSLGSSLFLHIRDRSRLAHSLQIYILPHAGHHVQSHNMPVHPMLYVSPLQKPAAFFRSFQLLQQIPTMTPVTHLEFQQGSIRGRKGQRGGLQNGVGRVQ